MKKENFDEKAYQFFIGLVAGEGSFCISLRKRDNFYTGFGVRSKFEIHLRNHDNEVLKWVRDYLNLGNITFDSEQKGNRGKTSRIRISSVKGCKELADFIYEKDNSFFKKTEKWNSFVKWKKCLNLINMGLHRTKKGMFKLACLREQINDDKRLKNDKKYVKNVLYDGD